MSSGGGQRRPWNLSEMVSPPINRSRWLQWTLLMSGSIVLGLGLIVTVIGIYNQHYYDPESHIVTLGEGEDLNADLIYGSHYLKRPMLAHEQLLSF